MEAALVDGEVEVEVEVRGRGRGQDGGAAGRAVTFDARWCGLFAQTGVARARGQP